METTSTGNRITDYELDLLRQRLAKLEAQLQGGQDLRTVTPQPGTTSSLQIEVKTTDGSYDNFVDGLEIDQNVVSESGNLAKLTLEHNLLADPLHGDTLAGTVVKGDLVAGNATPKWQRFPHGADGQELQSDSTQAQGLRWVTPTADVSPPSTPYWRHREYQHTINIGANGIVDGSHFNIPGFANPGTNFPAGAVQRQRPRYCADPNGSFEFGHHQWINVVWARIALAVTAAVSFDWIVQDVDNNFGVYRQTLNRGAGKINRVGGGTGGTLFSTGTGDDKANVGDMLLFDAGDNVGEALNISAVTSDTVIAFTNLSASGIATPREYKFLRKLYQASNQEAQTPVNATGTENLTAGTWIYHIFANNDSLQVAFNWITTMFSQAGIKFQDAGAESWAP